MIKYTILYKNGKAWNGKCKHMDDLQAQFVANDVLHITVTTQTSVHVLWPKRTWFDNVSVEQTVLDRHNGKFKLPRKPNPASVTKKQKAFDKAYAEWKINNSNLVDYDDGSGYMKYTHVGNGDTSIKAYKKWLWEQKQADPNGWIPWHGGKSSKCPLPYNTQVEVKFRCGDINDTLPAGEWAWAGGNGSHVIVAYRLLVEENKPVEYSEPKKAPIKVTYTFWLGQDGSVSDEL